MTPPATRRLAKPYFLFRTPDGLDSYFNRECRRLLLSPQEPLAGFLAPVVTNDEGKGGTIEYNLAAMADENLEPMASLPDTLREQLAQAIHAFLDRGENGENRISDHEKRLRHGFRLPDPDLEPDAYWLYGPVEDRRLLIFWGCEFRQNSSVKLRGDGSPNSGLLEKLAARRPTWRQTQDAAVRLIRERQLPLAPFLATPTTNASGQVDGFLVQGRKIPASDCRSGTQKIPDAWVQGFRSAAESHLARALPEAGGSDYEKALVCAVQLPDPTQLPLRFQRTKDALFIVLDGQETEEQCLHPTADVRLAIPQPRKATDGSVIMPDTVADKLGKSATRPSRLPLYACLAVFFLALSFGGFFFFQDRSHPELVQVIAIDNPRQVMVVFSEALDPNTIAGETSPAFRILHGERGHFLTIESIELVPNANDRVLITVEPLEERPYTLQIQGIADRSRNVMPHPQEHIFAFRDTTPPTIETISAHPEEANKLLIRFSKSIDPNSVRNPNAFQLIGFTVGNTSLSEDQKTVTVETREIFEHNREYSVRVQGIRDYTLERNPIAEGTTPTFTYRDTVPPVIERIAADRDQITVRVIFTKRLEQSSAETPGNFQLTAQAVDSPSEPEPIAIRAVRLLGDRRAVDIFTRVPLRNGITYRLTASGIRDQATPPNTLTASQPIEFLFQGAEDLAPPRIVSVQVEPNSSQRLVVTFDKPVNETSATQAEAYRIEEAPAEVIAVTATSDPTRVVVGLDQPLRGPASRHLQVIGVEDFLGNRIAESHRSPAFDVPGMASYANDLEYTLGSVRPSSDGEQIILNFEDALVPGPAQNTANYRLSGNVRISQIQLEPAEAPTTVTLILDPARKLATGTHRITLRNLRLEYDPDALQAEVTTEFRF